MYVCYLIDEYFNGNGRIDLQGPCDDVGKGLEGVIVRFVLGVQNKDKRGGMVAMGKHGVQIIVAVIVTGKIPQCKAAQWRVVDQVPFHVLRRLEAKESFVGSHFLKDNSLHKINSCLTSTFGGWETARGRSRPMLEEQGKNK
jgi:hypothetical protein